MRKVLGLGGFLLALALGTSAWELAHQGHSSFATSANLRDLLTWIGLFGILSLGQSFVIVTGGIDLSVGSLVALVGTCSAMMVAKGDGVSWFLVLPLMLAICALVGLFHGLMVTKARIQPFVVTLCGLFFYRGIARYLAADTSQGFAGAFVRLKWFGRGTLWDLGPGGDGVAPESGWQLVLDCVPAPFLLLLILAAAVGAYYHFSAQGRHLFALGANEDGARFSGIRTDRLKIQAYILCSLICGAGGILMAFKVNSIQPNTFGNFWELYAIAGAVLGGCSLRGGSGNVVAILLGVAIIRVLYNMMPILGIRSELEFVVIGAAILVGVCVDEFLARREAVRATRAA
ncbi:MAG: ABC transporter permease [bacterium]|nr:ABC transporter permease [bacterium]